MDMTISSYLNIITSRDNTVQTLASAKVQSLENSSFVQYLIHMVISIQHGKINKNFIFSESNYLILRTKSFFFTYLTHSVQMPVMEYEKDYLHGNKFPFMDLGLREYFLDTL